MKAINRLKIVLVEKGKTGKWLSEQLGKDPATVSHWCNNYSLSSIEYLLQNSDLQKVNLKVLFKMRYMRCSISLINIPNSFFEKLTA